MAKRVKRCEVVREPSEGGLGLFFSLDCGQSYVAYESLFQNTRVTGTLSIFVFDETDCTFTVTVETRNQAPIVRTVTPTETNRVINLTVDNLVRITFACTGTEEGFCSGFYDLQLRWCKCC